MDEENFQLVLNALKENDKSVQNKALKSLIKDIENEGKSKSTKECFVPLKKIKALVQTLLSSDKNNSHIINKFSEYLSYNDVLFFTWKVLPSIIRPGATDVYVSNALTLLEKLNVEGNEENKLLCGNDGTEFVYEARLTERSLNRFWGSILKWNFTPDTQKRLLIILLECTMNYLEKPLDLTSFLMDSLDAGGSIGLLALQGVFNMMQTHNLDYPDIYTKLYSMFEPDIFHTKTKARLFFLADLFLTSTHLPETMGAGFAKRLARLALIAPSEDILIICMFIGNLIIRHPGLKRLIHNTSATSLRDDPYRPDEPDPTKSNAIASSLWEIRSLQNHISPEVQKSASFIDSELPRIQWDIGKSLSDNGSDLFDREINKYNKSVSLNFEKPDRLSKNEKVFKYWHI